MASDRAKERTLKAKKFAMKVAIGALYPLEILLWVLSFFGAVGAFLLIMGLGDSIGEESKLSVASSDWIAASFVCLFVSFLASRAGSIVSESPFSKIGKAVAIIFLIVLFCLLTMIALTSEIGNKHWLVTSPATLVALLYWFTSPSFASIRKEIGRMFVDLAIKFPTNTVDALEADE